MADKLKFLRNTLVGVAFLSLTENHVHILCESVNIPACRSWFELFLSLRFNCAIWSLNSCMHYVGDTCAKKCDCCLTMQTSLSKYWLLGLFWEVARSFLIGTGQKSILDILGSGSCPTRVGYIVWTCIYYMHRSQ